MSTNDYISNKPEERDGRIVPIGPGDQSGLADLVIKGVTPRVSEWLPRLLADLEPITRRSVRDFVTREGDGSVRSDRVYRYLLDRLDRAARASWRETSDRWTDVDAEVAAYLGAISTLASRFVDVDEPEDRADHSEYKRGWYEELTEVTSTIGTGRGPYNAGRDALAAGPVALHRELDATPRTLRVRFDAPAWSDADPITAQRSLETLSTLARAFRVEVVLSSPGLVDALADVAGDWLREELDLTEPPDRSQRLSHASEGADRALRERAIEVVDELTSGHARILASLPREGSRSKPALRDDPVVHEHLQDSSVYRYLGDLEAQGVIAVDDGNRPHRLHTTALGEHLREYVTDEYAWRDPLQRELEASLTPTPQRSAGTVYRAHEVEGSGEAPRSAEGWLADTGDADAGGSYVQWLRGPTSFLDSWMMHERLSTGKRGDGVTLVDDAVKEFDDGRVAYISAFDDELLTVLQWGGPLPTLGRLAGALLSSRALSKVFDEDRAGSYFQELHDGAIEEFDEAIEDVIRWGHQVGWFSEDEENYTGWRDRVGGVRAFLLEKVGELVDSEEFDARGEVLRDLLGVVTSATHLYHAAGVDVTVNLRVPDTVSLEDEVRKKDFLGFIEALVPKQTVYRYHSGYRMLLEDREEKLRRRLGYEVDPEEVKMETTADVLISGPSATQFHEEIVTRLRSEADEVREQVREGEEDAAVMEIPVRIGNSFKAIKDLVREWGRRKGFKIGDYDMAPGEADDLDRLARFMLRAFNDAEAPHRANPHDVAEALLRMAATDRVTEHLSVDDLEAGLARMPADRLFPELRPTTTAIVQTLLVADEALGRSQIIERAGISGSTYDRRYTEAAALDLLEPREVEGRRRWTATLEPWWSPDADRDLEEVTDPFEGEEDGDLRRSRSSDPRFREVFSETALRVAKLTDDEALLQAWRAEGWPSDPLEAYPSPSAIDRYRAFLWATFASVEDLVTGPPDRGDRGRDEVVRIGRVPDEVDPEQLDLERVGSARRSTALGSSSAGPTWGLTPQPHGTGR